MQGSMFSMLFELGVSPSTLEGCGTQPRHYSGMSSEELAIESLREKFLFVAQECEKPQGNKEDQSTGE